MDQINNTLSSQQDNFQLKRFLNLIIGRWYLVLGSLLIALGIAYAIFRYQSPTYLATTTFVTKKFADNSGNSSLLRLSESGGSLVGGNQVFQEIPLLKSQSRIIATLGQLDFDISYFVEGRFKETEIYPTDFYKVTQFESNKYPYSVPIYLDALSDGKYVLETSDPEWAQVFEGKTFELGKKYTENGWEFKIDSKNPNSNGSNSHYFVVNHPFQLMNQYRYKLLLEWDPSGKSLLIASLFTEVPEKDIEFLNTYFKVIVQKGLDEKSENITNLLQFINEYIPQISDTLYIYQKRLDQLRLDNRELVNGSEFILEMITDLESKKAELMVSEYYYDHIVDYIKAPREDAVFAPALFGLEEEPLNMLLYNYGEIIRRDKADKNSFNEQNPLVIKSHEDLEMLEKNILESIKNLRKENARRMAELNKQIDFYYNTIGDLQVESREYSELSRMIALYEGVFDNLITKRTDAFLSQASIVSDYEMISNPGYNKSNPVSPDVNKVLIIAILSGLGFPLALLYIITIGNDKIVSKNDLLANTSIPLLGYVGHNLDKDDLAVHKKPKSLVAESFRRVRANLQYFNKGRENNVVLLTSSISEEGKTFCSTNLAFTYALSGKKTVLIGADMRKPTLSEVFGLNGTKGLSNYLAGQLEIKDVLLQTENKDLFIIPGGNIPPNPAELILTKRMIDLVTYLKKEFDLVIIDTPPIGLVADAIELMDFSDLNILIVRQGRTFKKSLHETTENYEKGQLKNMAILFNDVNFEKLEYGYKSYVEGYQTYGYGYGYGYFEEDNTDT